MDSVLCVQFSASGSFPPFYVNGSTQASNAVEESSLILFFVIADVKMEGGRQARILRLHIHKERHVSLDRVF